MKETSVLIEEYERIKEGDLLAIIDFFKLNEDSLLSKNSIELEGILYIYIDYLVALFEKSRYTRILEIIEKIESLNEFEKYRKSDINFDEKLRFYKYSSLFNKSNYKESKKGFDKLVKDFPENEDYHSWLIDSTKRISNKIFGRIMYSTTGLMFLILVIKIYWNLPYLDTISRITEGLFIFSIVAYFIDSKRKRKLPIQKDI